MKVTLIIAALFAVCSSSFGTDWMRANNLLRQFRNFEAYKELQLRASDKKCKADVVFILDRSTSIKPSDFEKGKVFLQDVVKLFDPINSNFSVITFARGATSEFSLNTYGHDQAGTLKAIENIEQRPYEDADQTQPWAALDLLSTYSSLPREDLPTILLITDGASQEPMKTVEAAKKAHRLGFKIYAIGIGLKVKMSELETIASSKENIHMVDDYSASLDVISEEVANELCEQNIENCEHNKALDVMFSVSEHANAQETESTFNLMSTVMKKAAIGPGKVQFGLARRDCDTKWAQISLNERDTVEGFEAELSSRVRSIRNTLALRLSYLARDAFRQGDQANANNVAVVFIDKKSDIDNQVTTRASQMNGVRVIVMAGGDVRASDVRGISSDVIYFGSYDQLELKAEDLLRKLCEALGRP